MTVKYIECPNPCEKDDCSECKMYEEYLDKVFPERKSKYPERKSKYCPLGMYTQGTDELKKLISEYPDYPVVVLCATELVADDSYCSWFAPRISFRLGEILDCDQDVNDERIFTDREEFEDELRDQLANMDEYENLPDEEFETVFKTRLSEYEPFWKKVIVIYADT